MLKGIGLSWPERRGGIRLRIAVSLAVLGVVAVFAQALVFLVIVDDKEEAFIEDLLNQQVEFSLQRWPQDPAGARPNTPDLRLYVLPAPAGEPVPEELTRLPVGNHELELGRHEFHVAVREAEGQRFIMTYNVEDHEARWRNILLLVSAALLVFCVLIAVVGYVLARRIALGLERLAALVDEDGRDALCEPGMGPEVERPATALDAYRLRQSQRVEHERAFAANLSHELRTPLTAIRTDAELLSVLPEVPDAVVRRGQRIVGSVDRINALATSLMLLARDMRPGLAIAVPLAQAIRQQWELLGAAHVVAPVLRCELNPACVVQTDPALLDLVLRNLLDNAVRHCLEGSVECRLEGSRLIVRDHGPGFADGELESVFERFYSARPGGLGLGLALVRHVCAACAWQVGAANHPDGGGEVWVDFGVALKLVA